LSTDKQAHRDHLIEEDGGDRVDASINQGVPMIASNPKNKRKESQNRVFLAIPFDTLIFNF
jgi:hypothetical protein